TAFTRALNLQAFYNASTGLTITSIITVGIMGSIMLLIAAFVFLAIAIMFLIRYVVLILVMILSPIYFVASALPKGTGIDKYKDQWMKALTGQAFFAPIYFLMTWIALRVLSGVMTAFGGGTSPLSAAGLANLSAGQAIQGNIEGVFLMVMNFAIVIVLLIASLTVAKNWAEKAGNGMGAATKWATGKAGTMSFGLAGRAGRGTIGRAGQVIADNEYLKSKPDSMAARLTLAAGRKTAGASFDARSSRLSGQLEAGKGQTGGFAKDLKDKVEAGKKYSETFKPSDLLVSNAEKELDNAKKNGTNADIAAAQARVDKIKGVNEDEARKREIKRIRDEALEQGGYKSEKEARKDLVGLETERTREIMRLKREENLSQKQAEEKADAHGVGWKPTIIKGAAVERKEAYAKDREEAKIAGVPISFAGRLGFVGPVKRERREEALAIRKTIKEKKPAEKIAEEIGKQAKEAADNNEEGGGGEGEPRSVGSGQTPAAEAASPNTPPPTP
ncbi:hypothetical protein KW784_02145, partial [Candidatus Parcubacteria bacterium]|nr:hypothetical protein [Candidatus Parcubacteria bacterium]